MYRHDLCDWNEPRCTVRVYSDEVHTCTTPVGFLDGTRIRMERPGGSDAAQLSVHNGHKRFYCPAYQTQTTPDGLILHIYSMVEDRLPDISMYHSSGLDQSLREHSVVHGVQHYVYGNKAYTQRLWM